MEQHATDISSWADEIAASEKFDHVILLGMGGSSLAPEVFASVFGSRAGYPELRVVDSTSPARIFAIDEDISRSLVIVSSKSGTTVETADLYSWFHARLQDLGKNPGDHLVAITDQGSWLHEQARDVGFLKIFLNPADIGGRYSALSYFGLVPAALIGIDLSKLLDHTRGFVTLTQAAAPDNPVLQLAKLMGDCALKGNHKLELNLAEPLKSLAIWIEQLIAESTGKEGEGIIPVYEDPASEMQGRMDDQCSVYIGLADEENPGAGSVSLEWELADQYDIGGEFLRWEMATALAASIMDINPFDQPNVEEAKQHTRLFVAGEETLSLNRVFDCDAFAIYTNAIANSKDGIATLQEFFDEFQTISRDATYLAILAYLPDFPAVERQLQRFRHGLAHHFNITTTLGYGPRYLHSTGQLHKGGPATGCFVQLAEQAMEEIAIPGRSYGFAALHRAQADGDYAVLERKGRPVMRIALKGDRLGALEKLVL
jgi:glucose-6-phosphate isomerase